MDLTIKFTGLCMFVRDPGRKRTHVLMPATPDEPDHRHDLTLDFPGLGQKQPLKQWVLDLSGAGGTGTGVDAPAEVLDAGTLADLAVDAVQWSSKPRDTVAARVTLPPFNGKPNVVDTVEWNVKIIRDADGTVLNETPQPLTHEVEWTVKDVDSSFFDAWKLDPLPGNPSGPLPLPRPVGRDEIRLEVKHLPFRDPKTKKGDEAPHFQMYYPIFSGKPLQRPHPFLNQDPPRQPPGGSPFNCILAQAPPE